MQVEAIKVLVELGADLEVFTLLSVLSSKLMNCKARQYMGNTPLLIAGLL
jgi:hypothetical protein